MSQTERYLCIKCDFIGRPDQLVRVSHLTKSGVCLDCARKLGVSDFPKVVPPEITSNTPAKGGCPICSEIGSTIFAWQAALKGEPEYLSLYPRFIGFREPMRRGSAWSCKRCSERFYLDDKEDIMYHVKPNLWSLLVRCVESPPAIPRNLYDKFTEIGIVEGQVHCCVIDQKGEKLSLALVRIGELPKLLFWSEGSIVLGSQIKDAEASPFALPYAIRKATYSAKQIDNGFESETEQTPVEGPGGRTFLLPSQTGFFSDGRIRGCQIRMSKKRPPYWSIFGPAVKYQFPSHLMTTVLFSESSI